MQALLFAALLANARAHVDGDRVLRAGRRAAARAAAVPALRRRARHRRRRGRAGADGRVRRPACAGRSSATLRAPSAAGRGLLARPDARLCASADRVRLATCRGGSTLALAVLRWPPSRALVARRAQSPRSAAMVRRGAPTAARGASVVRRGGLRALLPAAGRQAHRLRRLRAADLHLPLRHAAGAPRRAARLRAARAAARSGAIPALFVTVAIFALFFFYKIRIVPEHFWMARRFLPVILPAALLFACGRGAGGHRSGTRGARGCCAARSACVVPRAARRCSTRASAGRCWRTSSTPGIIPQARADRRDDRRRRPADRRVARRRRTRTSWRCRWPTSTTATSCCCARALPDKSAFASFLDWARTPLRAACCSWAAAAPTCCRRAGTCGRSPASGSRCRSTKSRPDSLPARRRGRRSSTTASTSSCRRDAGAPGGRFDLDVGTQDDLHVLRFHAKEASRRAHVPLVARRVVRLGDRRCRRAAAR